MINVFELCDELEKDFDDFKKFFKETETRALVVRIAESTRTPIERLVSVVKFDGADEAFVCNEIATAFARWASPEFRVWANKQIGLSATGLPTAEPPCSLFHIVSVLKGESPTGV